MKIPEATARVRDWLAEAGYEPDVREPGGIVVRLQTEHLEVPLLVHVDDVVSFDLYPFRFAGVRAENVDWHALVGIQSDASLVKIAVDEEFTDQDGDAPIYYAVQLPLAILRPDVVSAIVDLLKRFSEAAYDTVMPLVGLRENKPAKKKAAAKKKAPAKKSSAKKPAKKKGTKKSGKR
ncbi:MAG: hypothetical protein ACXVEF_11745 [Polyangiales bacterium]